MSNNSCSYSTVKRMLNEIFKVKHRNVTLDEERDLYKISTSDYELLANELSDIMDKSPPWSWRALQSVYVGSNKPGAKFMRAIKLLHSTMHGYSQRLEDMVDVNIKSIDGNVEKGAYVFTSSKLCDNPECGINFVPKVPNQKYCKKQCRSGGRKLLSSSS